MIDRSQVKQELKMRIRFAAGGTTPVAGRLLENVLELLEEDEKHEALEPSIEALNDIDRIYRCPNPECGKAFFYEKQRYCDRCGQAVKWE